MTPKRNVLSRVCARRRAPAGRRGADGRVAKRKPAIRRVLRSGVKGGRHAVGAQRVNRFGAAVFAGLLVDAAFDDFLAIVQRYRAGSAGGYGVCPNAFMVAGASHHVGLANFELLHCLTFLPV